jgi:hypothetical protein
MSLDKAAIEERRKRIADFLREFMIFFAVLFFTCVVGIIELLPEFESINGLFTWSWFAVSFLYFGLLLGVDYSVYVCFNLYEENKWVREHYGVGFFFPDLEKLIRLVFKKLRRLQLFTVAIVTFVFVLMYLVKIGLLK